MPACALFLLSPSLCLRLSLKERWNAVLSHTLAMSSPGHGFLSHGSVIVTERCTDSLSALLSLCVCCGNRCRLAMLMNLYDTQMGVFFYVYAGKQ